MCHEKKKMFSDVCLQHTINLDHLFLYSFILKSLYINTSPCSVYMVQMNGGLEGLYSAAVTPRDSAMRLN